MRRGFSIIGLLVTMACLLILGVIMANALNQAMTGSMSALPGTAASHEDRQYLVALYQSMAANAAMGGGRFLVPGELDGGELADNTTANLYSAMVCQHYTVPAQLISGNEYNSNVVMDDDYDYSFYDPGRGVWWDPSFVADLAVESNVSFAHVPLYGQRLRRYWEFGASHRTPILGNRGPLGGRDDPSSYTYGRNNQWAGHVIYGDGHVEFLETFTPGMLDAVDGRPDNIFAMEQGPDGADAILSFTRVMTPQGPVLQHD